MASQETSGSDKTHPRPHLPPMPARKGPGSGGPGSREGMGALAGVRHEL